MHIKQNHYQCDLCRQDKPYMVYKDYTMLRRHFETSHFPCQEPECVEMRTVVFNTEHELEYHTEKTHRRAGKKGKFNAGDLLGVRLHDDDDDDDGYALSSSPSRGRGGRGGRGGMAAPQGRGANPRETIGKDFTSIVVYFNRRSKKQRKTPRLTCCPLTCLLRRTMWI